MPLLCHIKANNAPRRSISERVDEVPQQPTELADHPLEAELRAAARSDVLYGNVQMIGQVNSIPDGAFYGGPFDLGKLLTCNISHQAIFYR